MNFVVTIQDNVSWIYYVTHDSLSPCGILVSISIYLSQMVPPWLLKKGDVLVCATYFLSQIQM